MNDEDFNQKIKEYLKENLGVNLSITDADFSDSKVVVVSLYLDDEFIHESTDYVG